MRRLLAFVCLLSGIGILGVAALDYFEYAPFSSLFSGDLEPYLEVSPTEFELAEGKPGTETRFVVVLTNPSSRPVQVIGVGEC